MTKTIREKRWAIEIAGQTPTRMFLYWHGGDWGPQHALTPQIEKATLWPTEEAAKDYYVEHRHGLGYEEVGCVALYAPFDVVTTYTEI